MNSLIAGWMDGWLGGWIDGCVSKKLDGEEAVVILTDGLKEFPKTSVLVVEAGSTFMNRKIRSGHSTSSQGVSLVKYRQYEA